MPLISRSRRARKGALCGIAAGMADRESTGIEQSLLMLPRRKGRITAISPGEYRCLWTQ
jgi:hypothetical protein